MYISKKTSVVIVSLHFIARFFFRPESKIQKLGIATRMEEFESFFGNGWRTFETDSLRFFFSFLLLL